MSDQIAWVMTTSAGGKRRKFWGTTDAATDAEIIDAFAQVWTKVLTDVLQWYSPQEWDGLLCAMNIYEGTFDFSAIMNFDLRQLLTGCSLKFDELEEITHADFPSDAEFDAVCHAEEERFIRHLVAAWQQVSGTQPAQDVVGQAPLPFRVVDEPTAIGSPRHEMLLTAQR